MRPLLPILLVLLAVPTVGAAQRFTGGVQETSRPVPGLDRIGVDERLDQQMPLDVPFRDHTGRAVTLRDYFDGERPVMLTFAYHSCPSLCSLVLDATERAAVAQEWTPGVEYQMVTISIDPRDTPEKAAEKRAASLAEVNRDGSEWAFLVGDQESIARVTTAAGYRYFYDERQQQYAHTAAAMFLTPEGKLARYLYGLRFETSDVRLALLEASEGRSISAGERILLYCYSYDEASQGYVLMAWNVMKIGGALCAFALFAFIFVLWRRERRRGGLFDEGLEGFADAPRAPTDTSKLRTEESALPRPAKQVEA